MCCNTFSFDICNMIRAIPKARWGECAGKLALPFALTGAFWTPVSSEGPAGVQPEAVSGSFLAIFVCWRAKRGTSPATGPDFWEASSLAHVLGQTVGRTFQATCDAALGDARCGVDLEDPAFGHRARPRQRQLQVAVRRAHGVGDAGDDHHDRAAIAEQTRRLVEGLVLIGGDGRAAGREVDLEAFRRVLAHGRGCETCRERRSGQPCRGVSCHLRAPMHVAKPAACSAIRPYAAPSRYEALRKMVSRRSKRIGRSRARRPVHLHGGRGPAGAHAAGIFAPCVVLSHRGRSFCGGRQRSTPSSEPAQATHASRRFAGRSACAEAEGGAALTIGLYSARASLGWRVAEAPAVTPKACIWHDGRRARICRRTNQRRECRPVAPKARADLARQPTHKTRSTGALRPV